MCVPNFIKSYLSTFLDFPRDCQFGFLLCLIEAIFMGVYYFLSLYITETLHFNIVTAGLIISCYGIGAILGGILGGRLSDAWTPGTVSTYSLFIQAFAYSMLIVVNTPGLLMLNVMILGIASYGFVTANHLFVLGNCNDNESQRLKAIGTLSIASNFGMGLSALIIGETLFMGFHFVFSIASFLILCLAIFSIGYFNSKFQNATATHIQHKMPQHQVHTSSIKTDKSIFIMVLVFTLMIGMIITQLGTSYTIYIKDVFPYYGLQSISMLFALNSFIIVVASTLVCKIIENYNKTIMLGFGSFLIGFGMLILVFSRMYAMAIASCIIYTFGEIIFFSVAQLLCYQFGQGHKKGTSLGIYRSVYALSRISGPAAGGWIYYQFGSDTLWIICGMIGATCLASSTVLMTWKLHVNSRTTIPNHAL